MGVTRGRGFRTRNRWRANFCFDCIFYHDFAMLYSFFLLDFILKVWMLQSVIFHSIYSIKNLLVLFVGVQASRNSVTTRRCQATCFPMLRNNGSAPSILVVHVVIFYGMLCKLLVVISTVVLVWPAYFSKFENLGIILQIVLINVVAKNSFRFLVPHSFDAICYNSVHYYLGLTL